MNPCIVDKHTYLVRRFFKFRMKHREEKKRPLKRYNYLSLPYYEERESEREREGESS